MANNIFYKGPKRKYDGPDGSNRERKEFSGEEFSSRHTFADMDHLQRLLSILRSESVISLMIYEEEMSKWYMDPTETNRDDATLFEAILDEWPSGFGDVDYKVPYPFYDALRIKNTASASYIRKRWEEQARGPHGALAFDLIPITRRIRDETELVTSFLARYVGNVDDSSEYRVMELLQEWATSGLAVIRTFKSMHDVPPVDAGFSDTELSAISKDDANKFTPILTLKINAINEEIERANTSLDRGYFQFSKEFYEKVLGPSMEFRLSVSRKLEPVGSKAQRAFYSAGEVVDDIFKSNLIDLVRRNETFTMQAEILHGLFRSREVHRVMLGQMLSKGGSVVNTLKREDKPKDYGDWDAEIRRSVTPTNLSPLHNKLEGRSALDAHPHYLDRFGRNTVQADIKVSDGVRIDGVDVGSHRHTGEDGSERIRGEDIVGLVASSIDRDAGPEEPEDLRLVSMEATPSGGVNVTLTWTGYGDDVYDVSLAAIEEPVTDMFTLIKKVGDIGERVIVDLKTSNGSDFACIASSSDERAMYSMPYGEGSIKLFTEEDLDMFIGEEDIADPPSSLSVRIDSMDFEVDSVGNIFMPFPSVGNIDPTRKHTRGVLLFGRRTDRWRMMYDPQLFHGTTGTSSVVMDARRGEVYSIGYYFEDLINQDDEVNMRLYLGKVPAGGQDLSTIERSSHAYMGPMKQSDFGIDGYIYTLTDAGVFRIHPTRVEVDQFLPITSEMSSAFSGNRVNGFVVLRDEFLVTLSPNTFNPNTGAGSSRLRMVSISKSDGKVNDVTAHSKLKSPIGLARDRHGRVYSIEFGENEIYRIFGPNGTGVL